MKKFEGNEQKYVQIQNNGGSTICMGATIVNNEIKYLVSIDGEISYPGDYEATMAEYIKACFKRINGVDTFYSK